MCQDLAREILHIKFTLKKLNVNCTFGGGWVGGCEGGGKGGGGLAALTFLCDTYENFELFGNILKRHIK